MAPANAQEIVLHQQLLEGDETASAKIIERYMGELVDYLAARRSEIATYDSALIVEAVTDALLDYTDCPAKYDPQKKSLPNYLRMAAEGDLLNRWDKIPAAEREGKVVSFEEIEEHGAGMEGDELWRRDDPTSEPGLTAAIFRFWQTIPVHDLQTNPQEILEFLDHSVELEEKGRNRKIGAGDELAPRPATAAILQEFWRQVQTLVPDQRERLVMILMMEKIHETGQYAQALAITHLPEEEQTNAVKRVKDKLKKRLQRADWSRLKEAHHG